MIGTRYTFIVCKTNAEVPPPSQMSDNTVYVDMEDHCLEFR